MRNNKQPDYGKINRQIDELTDKQSRFANSNKPQDLEKFRKIEDQIVALEAQKKDLENMNRSRLNGGAAGASANFRPINERPINERPINERSVNERSVNERHMVNSQPGGSRIGFTGNDDQPPSYEEALMRQQSRGNNGRHSFQR